MTISASTLATDEVGAAHQRSRSINRRILASAWSTGAFRLGFFVFLVMLLASLITPLLSPISATRMEVHDRFLAPLFLGPKWEWIHPLDTDELGRDMLMRCLVGLSPC